MNNKLNPWPSYTQEEIQSVSQVLSSGQVNYWTGDQCKMFEKEFAYWCGSKYAITTSNGTTSLYLALKALAIGHGDEVIVTPRSFIASVSCVVNAGATPIFADVDLNSGNITAQTIREKISDKTKAIICVHLAGYPCEMEAIMCLAKKHNIFVIEDCAQAHGAKYQEQSVGSIADIGCFSFCQDKIMTTGGEGGMVVTNHEALWRIMWAFKDHGKSYSAVFEKDHPPGFRWLHESFGSNFRMTEMQAAIGRIQLTRMDDWHAKRTHNAKIIMATLAKFPQLIFLPKIDKQVEHAWYKLYAYVQINALANNWSRDRIVEEINQLGVPCYSGSCSEIYLEKAFDQKFRPNERLENARLLGETSLAFLVHPTLSSGDLEKTCSVLETILNLASKSI